MRRRLVQAVIATATAAAAALSPVLVKAAATPAEAATPATTAYSWKSVAIGGGGFVPNIVFNTGAANIVYARTDIGGVYRWNQSTSSWTSLMDWVGQSNWGYEGGVSIAADPINTNKVWVAAGMYTNSWDPNNGAILRSSDQGNTWSVSTLPFKLGGNMPGRGMGERLAVDPNNDNVLYFGAPSGKGLWKSTDSGVTWSQVANFPNVGNYAQDATDTSGYLADNQGVTWVAFDKATGTGGSATKTIFVGVADLQNTVYQSTDAGATWSRVAGQPTGFMAHKGVVDPANGILYIATSNKGGPYDGSSGDVWKYTLATGTWTQISPVKSSDTSNDYYGYSGLSIDAQHPSTIMVTGYSSWWPDTFIFRSTDGGATWKQAWNFTSYPNRADAYTMDATATPWLSFNTATQEPTESPKLGWMTEGLAIDPFNSNRMFYGTGATLFGTTNLTNWDSGTSFTIKPFVAGLEETAVNGLISPPSGAPLISALGDIDGFVHTSLTSVPSAMFDQPNLSSGDSVDYAELQPATLIRTGDIDKTQSGNANVNRFAFSTNGGSSWFQASAEPGGVTGGGLGAIAADASSALWSPKGAGVYYTTTYGSSWTASTGIPAGAVIAADRVSPKVYYGYSAGKFYVSTNGGASFTATAATGLPDSGNVYIKALPGAAGDVWLTGGDQNGTSGIWHSTNSGASFTKLSSATAAINLGFGKSAAAGGYPALYAIATVNGVQGIFRSDDTGASWTRINDAQHQWGNIGAAITGDPRTYGRVYVGTNGRGIVYGDPSGTSTGSPSASASPSPSASASSSPSASASPSPSRSASPSASASASPSPSSSGFGCHITYTKNSEWPGGFTATVTINNTGTTTINGWTVKFTFPGDQVVTGSWNNGSLTQSGKTVTATNASYNGTIAPGGNTNFGFQGTWTSNDSSPTSFTLNGTTCT